MSLSNVLHLICGDTITAKVNSGSGWLANRLKEEKDDLKLLDELFLRAYARKPNAEEKAKVMELLKDLPERVYPVGRLDYASEGLLLMTNDGALAQKLMKAGSHAPKTYLVKISGKPDERALARLQAGVAIELEDGTRVKTSPAKIRLMEDGAKGSGEWRVARGERDNPWYEVVLIEGRNRQIRRMFQSVGFLVEKIKRVQLGPLVLDVAPGKFRALTVREVAKLKSL